MELTLHQLIASSYLSRVAGAVSVRLGYRQRLVTLLIAPLRQGKPCCLPLLPQNLLGPLAALENVVVALVISFAVVPHKLDAPQHILGAAELGSRLAFYAGLYFFEAGAKVIGPLDTVKIVLHGK